MADQIILSGIRAVGTHGVLPIEREQAQPFEVDLLVDADLRTAGASDDLGDTIDYGALAASVVAIIGGPSRSLMEALASDIASAVLRDARITAVDVTVRKLRPPVPLDMSSAAVRVVRTP